MIEINVYGQIIKTNSYIVAAIIEQYILLFRDDKCYVMDKIKHVKDYSDFQALSHWWSLDQRGKATLSNCLNMKLKTMILLSEGLRSLNNGGDLDDN